MSQIVAAGKKSDFVMARSHQASAAAAASASKNGFHRIQWYHSDQAAAAAVPLAVPLAATHGMGMGAI